MSIIHSKLDLSPFHFRSIFVPFRPFHFQNEYDLKVILIFKSLQNLPTQSLSLSAPIVRVVVPWGHASHSFDPFTLVYVPLGQGWHGLPWFSRPVGENFPAIHLAVRKIAVKFPLQATNNEKLLQRSFKFIT